MSRHLAAVLLVLVARATVPLAAQEERITFRHLTIADGLSQNAVHAIEQDRRGFLWFGTKDGRGTLWVGTDQSGLSIR